MGGARRRLVELLREKGVHDMAVLRAFDLTPRHQFVPTGVRHRAYEDAPLQIGSGQTISQPSIHARYLEILAFKGSERVLEIGTGSGYQTVLLSHLVAQVFTIERIPALFTSSREAIKKAGATNVSMLLGDGTVGWREYAPYDAILVSAGGPTVPQALVEQLADGGRMLVPVGSKEEQTLTLVMKRAAGVETKNLGPVRFVPLFGTQGWEQQ
jgi:protein-L-isoaspartate(D-aspartate) O-methyltransferase